MRWICGHLAPSPNHIALASGMGYRGQLIEFFATDDARVDPEARAHILGRFHDNLAGMIASSGAVTSG